MSSTLRPEVMAFAQAMERVLRQNDYKGGWERMSVPAMSERLDEEVAELQFEIARPPISMIHARILKEATDVANFCMFLADVYGGLRYDPGEPCWLCGVADGVAITTIKVARDTPHGPPCDPKDVQVHPGCYQDMEP